MKTYLLAILVLLIAGCGNQRSRQGATAQSVDAETTINSSAEDVTEKSDTDVLLNSVAFKPWNEIRFGNWTDKDWYDNDYFRFLRKFIDACYNDEDQCEVFEHYKYALNSKFAIAEATPFVGGGMFIIFVFLDVPNIMFDTCIYSYVNEDTETVEDYEVRHIGIYWDNSGLTKEDILSAIEEHPDNKLW